MPSLDKIVYVKTPRSGIRNHVEDRFIAKHNGFEFIGRDYGSDEYVLVEMFLEDTYGWFTDPIEGGLVIDIGANIGAFSIPASKKNRLIAYEPELNNLAYLKANKELSDCNFEIRAVAVGEPGTTGLISNHNGGAVLDKWMEHNGKQTVDIIGLDEVLNNEECDFLKMDCEGGEYDAFKHANPGNLTLIKRFAMEAHPQLVSEQEHKDLLKLLDDFFHIKQLGGSRIFGVRR